MSLVEVHVSNSQENYKIWISQDALNNFKNQFNWEKYSSIVVITDTLISDKLMDKFKQKMSGVDFKTIVVDSGESNKNIQTWSFILQKMIEFKCDRHSLVLNFGGGVVGDIGGFAASTFMRGVDFIQIPTTLLAQVDASVGGKLGLDFSGLKNSVGVFNQPQAVVIDLDFLDTLPEREFLSGKAEILKYGLIADREFFSELKKVDWSDKVELEKIIHKSCQIKADIVETDTKELGLRKILNFGHTIGHALESLCLEYGDDYLLHGEAVALGMVAEGHLSVLDGRLDHTDFLSLESGVSLNGLQTRFDLSKYSKNIEVEEFIHLLLERMSGDKKNVRGKVKWVLLDSIGKAGHDFEADEINIIESLNYILK